MVWRFSAHTIIVEIVCSKSQVQCWQKELSVFLKLSVSSAYHLNLVLWDFSCASLSWWQFFHTCDPLQGKLHQDHFTVCENQNKMLELLYVLSVKSHHDLARLDNVWCFAVSVSSFSSLLYLIAVHFSVECDMMSVTMFLFIDTDLLFSFPLLSSSFKDQIIYVQGCTPCSNNRVVIISKDDKAIKTNSFPVCLHPKSN